MIFIEIDFFYRYLINFLFKKIFNIYCYNLKLIISLFLLSARLSAQILDFIYDISVCERNAKNRLQSSVLWCIICKG